MRDPSALTIYADVSCRDWKALRRHLKTNVNPDENGILPVLKFDDYPNLHFVSFFMLRAMEKPSSEDGVAGHLVMEATFDGPEDAFIRDLVACDLDAVISIFGKCAGFPKTAKENPHLVEIFLQQRSLQSQTFFSGAPGKTVTQIRREQGLRRKLGDILRKAPASLMAAEPRRLQDHLRRAALAEDDLRPLSQAPRPTKSLLDSRRMMQLAIAALSVPVFLFGAIPFCFDAVEDAWRGLVSPDLDGAFGLLLIASILLLALNYVRHWAQRGAKEVNPRSRPFVVSGLAGGGQLIVRIIMTIVAIRAVFLIARHVEERYWPDCWVLAIPLFILVLIGFVIVYLFVLYLGAARGSAGRLQRADPKRLRPWRATFVGWALFVGFWTLFALSLAPFVTLLTVLGAPDTDEARYVWSWIVLLGGWFSAGVVIVLTIWVILLALHDRLQKCDNRGLINPLDLYDRPEKGMHRWADEEHRYQRRQNHYVSLTNVKGGNIRYCLLILALTIVNFLARYKDNKGTLGGIPTIFSARWALIDEGERLLFMTNYSGAWDSYLNEFSELASVFGVNLIWTNTYIAPHKDGEPGVRFPETELFTGRGARKTLPFKAYVRRSQVETLVWYSAYPELSVVNVSENARIREAVFGPADAAALDLLLKRL